MSDDTSDSPSTSAPDSFGGTTLSTLTLAAAAEIAWDLVVIGGGTAGLVASRTAAGFGARVLLIERHRLGGDCLWTGCVPSKSLIVAARAAHSARTSARLGVTTQGVTVDFAAVMQRVTDAMLEVAPADSTESLAASGVDVLIGEAAFTGERSISVDGTTIGFRQALISTGGSPVVPDIDGIDGVDVLTSETLWNIRDLPERLLVLGGGAIGCEIGHAMTRLGSTVTLVHRGERILPKEERRASQIVHAAMTRDGVDIRTSSEVVSFTASPHDRTRGSATLDDGSVVEFDRVVVALGRTPNTGSLQCARAIVRLDEKGDVRVDAHLRSSNPRVWAAGDMTGLPQFTHTAGVNGSLAATNAILGLTRSVDTAAVPRVTFTDPEVAAVGLSPTDADANGARTITIDHADLDRAIAESETDGYTSIVVDAKGRILGATIVGPRAGETLGEASVAVKNGLSTSSLAGATHAYPTFSDALWQASVSDVRTRLGQGLVSKATGVLGRIRASRVK
ncbi:dihydrolipoyl dehydrogenase family protein [Marisediminicola sp. LYQ134]|uniref:dihydrolipoyl dehydrogenase family protein n=1 Tax=unclassified Marisediminicola TaxID=2618316 RepID=UPI0039832D85